MVTVLMQEYRPMVSVAVLTYNHEKYIKQALDSILRQKVNFDYEILIGDDASTDNTVKVLKEYITFILKNNRNNIKLLLFLLSYLFIRFIKRVNKLFLQ